MYKIKTYSFNIPSIYLRLVVLESNNVIVKLDSLPFSLSVVSNFSDKSEWKYTSPSLNVRRLPKIVGNKEEYDGGCDWCWEFSWSVLEPVFTATVRKKKPSTYDFQGKCLPTIHRVLSKLLCKCIYGKIGKCQNCNLLQEAVSITINHCDHKL